MRIIAGEKRGLKLLSLEGDQTRPTLDRVKEALFGRLQFELRDARVLDLFAGSGALGLEALSRGAKKAVFVDMSGGAEEVIWHNVAAAGMQDRAAVVKNDYLAAMKLFQNSEKFDIVFLDPPYEAGHYEAALQGLAEYGLLARDAVVVVESAAPLGILPKGFIAEKQKKYGKALLSFYRWKEE